MSARLLVRGPSLTTGKRETMARLRPKLEEARRIWESIPTPLYDELRYAVSGKSISESESIFHQYVGKLKTTYPGCKIDTDPRGPYGLRSGNTYQRFESGENYYLQFKRAEKACQVNRMFDRKIKQFQSKKRFNRNLRETINVLTVKEEVELPPFQTEEDLESYLTQKEKETELLNKMILEEEANRAKRAASAESKRLASVKTGNLLSLGSAPEPNFLTFGSTKEGLVKRENELKNLFKGGKTRRNRKSRKTRKQNRK